MSVRLAALSSGTEKSRVDVEKVKAQLQKAGLKLYEAKYWNMTGAQPRKD